MWGAVPIHGARGRAGRKNRIVVGASHLTPPRNHTSLATPSQLSQRPSHELLTRAVFGGPLHQWWCAYARSKQRANALFRERWPAWKQLGLVATAVDPGAVATDMNHGKGPRTPQDSARDVLRLCSSLTLEQHGGKFYHARGAGERISW